MGDDGEEVPGELFVPCGDAPEVLDIAEGIFRAVSLAIARLLERLPQPADP